MAKPLFHFVRQIDIHFKGILEIGALVIDRRLTGALQSLMGRLRGGGRRWRE